MARLYAGRRFDRPAARRVAPRANENRRVAPPVRIVPIAAGAQAPSAAYTLSRTVSTASVPSIFTYFGALASPEAASSP